MPCRIASSADSRGVQAVKVPGAPDRGASAKTAAMARARADDEPSANDNRVMAASQRPRHLRTVFGVQPTCRASGSLRWSAPAPRIIRTRKASACEHDARRNRALSTCPGREVHPGCQAGIVVLAGALPFATP